MLPFYLQLLIVKEIFHIFLMKKIQYFFKWFLMKLVKAWMLSIINNTSQICELLFVFRFVYDYSRADWDSLHDHLRDFNFKLNASVAASKYRFFITNISSSLTHLHGLRLFFAAATVHRNLFFRLYEQNKSSESKVKFIQASNCYKKVLGAAKLAYNNTKESIFSQKLGSWGFWQIINCVFNKVKSALHPLFSGAEVLSSASDKAKLFAKNVSKNSSLNDSAFYLPVFFSRTNLKLHNTSVTPKIFEKVITSFDSPKTVGLDFIPMWF